MKFPTFLVFLRRAKDLGELDFADLDRLDDGLRALESTSAGSRVGFVRVEDQGPLVGRQLAVVEARGGAGAEIRKKS